MAEEFLSLLFGRDTILTAWTKRPAPYDEGPVSVDHFLGVDGLVVHGDVEITVSGDELSNVGRHAVHDRVGDEHSAKVVRGIVQRLAVASGDSSSPHDTTEQVADRLGRDGTALGAEVALK